MVYWVSKYKTDFVCKTYTKITVGGEQFVVYGEPVVGNVYDTAKEILADTTITAEMRNSLSKIILDYDNEAGFPGDEL